jgi:hypothetical protein
MHPPLCPSLVKPPILRVEIPRDSGDIRRMRDPERRFASRISAGNCQKSLEAYSDLPDFGFALRHILVDVRVHSASEQNNGVRQPDCTTFLYCPDLVRMRVI